MDIVVAPSEALYNIETGKGLKYITNPVLPSFLYKDTTPIDDDLYMMFQYTFIGKNHLKVKFMNDVWDFSKIGGNEIDIQIDGADYIATSTSKELISNSEGYVPGMMKIYNAVQFLLQQDVDAMTVEDKVAHRQKKPRKNNKKSNVIRHYKVYTLNRDYEIKHRKGKHPITVECYSVIGHERHLKNGKVVFVSPHFRGKHRDEPEKYWKGVERRLFPCEK